MSVPIEAIPKGMSEQEVLVALGNLANQSLVASLQGQKGHYYTLTPNLYAREDLHNMACVGTSSISVDAQGSKFPNGIGEFVEGALREPDCKGVVPLTDVVAKQLEEQGLQPILQGLKLEPEKVKFEVYGRRG